MSWTPFDASTVLVLFQPELGAERVWLNLPLQPINTVNLAEVVTKLSAAGISETAIQKILMLLNLTIIHVADLIAYEELERLEEIFELAAKSS